MIIKGYKIKVTEDRKKWLDSFYTQEGQVLLHNHLINLIELREDNPKFPYKCKVLDMNELNIVSSDELNYRINTLKHLLFINNILEVIQHDQ